MRIPVIVSVLGAAALAAGCGSSPRSTAEDGAASPAVAVTVDRAAVVDRPVRFEVGGVVRARSTALVTSRVTAPILTVHVRAGDRVTRGQRLVTLDGREMAARAEGASSAVAVATSAAQAAESRIAEARANLVLARATHDRLSELHAKRSATTQELDQAVASLGAAEAQVSAATAAAASASAARDAARSAADAAGVSLSYTVLTAPFDGIVGERLADPGSLAAPNMPLLVVEDVTALTLETTLDEARAAGVTIGQGVEIRLDGSDADEWVPARVAEVGRTDSDSHSFVVKVEVPARASARTGAFGRARFTTTTRRSLTVPEASLVRRGQLTFVFLVGSDSRAHLRPVVTGATVENRTEVLAGVTAGDRVVVDPPPVLVDGGPVDPEEVSAQVDAPVRGARP